jgi:CHAT domain
MPRALRWEWSMTRNESAAPRSILGTKVPHEDGPDWDYAYRKLLRLQQYVFELHVKRTARSIALTGSVASEQIKEVVEETFRDYDPDAEVSNLIIVTAAFRSAEDDDDYRKFDGRIAMDATIPATTVPVSRYPAFTSEEMPSAGERFRFELDLLVTATEKEPFQFKAPPKWTVVGVDVDVISAQLLFAEGANRRKIILESDGSSIAARFDAEVTGVTDDGNVDVQVLFNCMGRYSGMSANSFKAAERMPASRRTTAGGAGGNAVSVHPAATVPDLTIKIFKAGSDAQWIWILEAPNAGDLGKASRQEIVSLPDTETFATGLLQQCPDLQPGRHVGAMRGIGERIWAASPETFRLLYKDMREKFGPAFPIQIVTNEPHIPWEMMYPDTQSGIDDPDHLFMTHPVCRWHAALEGRFRTQFARGLIASFVPAYKDALPEAIAEGKWLISNLGAKEMDPTWETLTKFWSSNLPDKPVGILHFAGHGENRPVPRIRLSDGWVSCDDVHGGVTLGRRDGTFVVLNACETGSGALRLGLASGWAANLTAAEFGGVLAPLWKVEDADASEVVRQYLAEFCRGVPMGQALLHARRAARQASATPFAYICHGDVTAKMR